MSLSEQPIIEGDHIPEARTYLHDACHGGTVVSGHDFVRITDPFALGLGGYCAACQRDASLRVLRWVETGESVADYRKRLRRHSPALVKFWVRGGGPVVGAVVGGGLGALVAWVFPNALNPASTAVIAGISMGATFLTIFGKPYLYYKLKLDYRRML